MSQKTAQQAKEELIKRISGMSLAEIDAMSSQVDELLATKYELIVPWRTAIGIDDLNFLWDKHSSAFVLDNLYENPKSELQRHFTEDELEDFLNKAHSTDEERQLILSSKKEV
ncbi:hypothetical protein ESZ50_04935 [Weissella muntiaci]|uniref:Uncharacterized protein n=1 Tax=Weissella muntiaci TaxID=2508881 RepID=A0A6C2C7I2_9LACO|nr:hypothetical protein [Weissella muntiaci]TYC49938.1 hypothetical protein ESZ50_04935 [Weissella muntiaci]